MAYNKVNIINIIWKILVILNQNVKSVRIPFKWPKHKGATLEILDGNAFHKLISRLMQFVGIIKLLMIKNYWNKLRVPL